MDNTVIKIYRLWEIIYFFEEEGFRMCFQNTFISNKSIFFFFYFAIYNLLSLFTIANFSKILRVKEDKNLQLLLTLPSFTQNANDSI